MGTFELLRSDLVFGKFPGAHMMSLENDCVRGCWSGNGSDGDDNSSGGDKDEATKRMAEKEPNE